MMMRVAAATGHRGEDGRAAKVRWVKTLAVPLLNRKRKRMYFDVGERKGSMVWPAWE